MCGRYYIEADDVSNDIIRMLGELNRAELQIKTGEVFPTNLAPVIAKNRRMELKPFMMKWGFAGGKSLVINARSETAGVKPMFRNAMINRRLIVPASGYYEWERGTREKYAIAASGKITYMAGLYRLEESANTPSFVILTRDAAPSIAFIHPRMPVLLPEAAVREWLTTEYPENVLAEAVEEVSYQSAN